MANKYPAYIPYYGVTGDGIIPSFWDSLKSSVGLVRKSDPRYMDTRSDFLKKLQASQWVSDYDAELLGTKLTDPDKIFENGYNPATVAVVSKGIDWTKIILTLGLVLVGLIALPMFLKNILATILNNK